MPSCSQPSRTLRAAEAVARRRAILDRRCARRQIARVGRDGRMVPDRTKGLDGRRLIIETRPKSPTRFHEEAFFKKRPTERCEIFETRPRRIASSAISRWLQWLIGRSLSDGFSQVIAITAQICPGVYVAGAPDRGASGSGPGTDS